MATIPAGRWTVRRPRSWVREGTAERDGGPDEYAELKRRIVAAGLLERQPVYYAVIVSATLLLLAGAVALAVMADTLWLRMAAAVVLAVAFAHLAFLGHDSGHYQVFSRSRDNRRMQMFLTLVLGVSLSWWVEKHNRHHSFPNAPGADPDIDLPVLAFSEEDAVARGWPWRGIIKYQSVLFFPIIALEGFGLRLASTAFLLRKGARYPKVEPFFIAAHFAIYGALLFAFMPVGQALLFVTVHHLVTGLYLGSIFAPNHKGMELIEQDEDISFLRRQVLTSRNIAAHPVTDILYGGQNFQIEHHLFPNMPRNNLRKARAIVVPYLKERGIPYVETGMFGSYAEILGHLHRVSAPLRSKSAGRAGASRG